MSDFDIHAAIAVLKDEYRSWKTPAVTIVAQCDGSPFKVLVSCIISLRTKDEVTAQASARLFERAATPDAMQSLPVDEVAGLIYPAGFYRNKALQIIDISRRLMDEYGGAVPDEIDGLLMFKGVGRKTAKLGCHPGFGQPGFRVGTPFPRDS